MDEPLTLYTIPLSHSACAARLMLGHKGLRHRQVRLISGLHRPALRVMGFRRGTVPALRVGSRRIEGTLEISRALDEMVPEPPLRPVDPERRRRLDEVERWGEERLQPVPRRLFRWAVCRHPAVRRQLAEVNHLPFPRLVAPFLKPVAAYYARLSGAHDDAVQRDLQELPELLDQVDAWIADGTLGGERLSAADCQIAPSVRLLMNIRDLDPILEGRPAAELALHLLPEYDGRLPPSFPSSWLPGASAVISD